MDIMPYHTMPYHAIIIQYRQLFIPAAERNERRLQIHRHSHTITMHQQTGRQVPTQHLHVADVRLAARLVRAGPLDRRRERREHHRRLLPALSDHQLVQDQVLCPAGEVVEG